MIKWNKRANDHIGTIGKFSQVEIRWVFENGNAGYMALVNGRRVPGLFIDFGPAKIAAVQFGRALFQDGLKALEDEAVGLESPAKPKPVKRATSKKANVQNGL